MFVRQCSNRTKISIKLILIVALLMSLCAGSAEKLNKLNKRDPVSYEGLSVGEAWDLRYGHGEQAGDYMGTWTIANCDSSAILYDRPDIAADELLEIKKWEDVEAYYYDSEWFECEYLGKRGYILREFLTDRPGKYVDYPGNSAQ